MKILFLLPYSPVPPNSGNKNLTFNLLRSITYYACCDLVILADNNQTDDDEIRYQILKELPKINNIWIFHQTKGINDYINRFSLILRGYPPSINRYKSRELYSWLDKHLKITKYDLIHFDMIRMVQYRSACQNLPSLLIASDSYSMALKHNRILEKKLEKKIIWFLNETTVKNYEEHEYEKFSLVCTVSDIDTQDLKSRIQKTNIKTIGIPIDHQYLKSSTLSPLRRLGTNPLKILCTGAISVSVVAQEVIDFIENCYFDISKRLPKVELTILGRNPTLNLKRLIESHSSIHHINYVEDYISFLQQDWVYVYPQKSGSGLQTKVQQAMALGLPVAGFSRAFAGLHITNGVHGLECSSYSEITEKLIHLLTDTAERDLIGMTASNHIQKNFSIEKVGEDMFDLYKSIL